MSDEERFRWECPHEWLQWRTRQAIEEEDNTWLRVTIDTLARVLDHDQLRELFEREMDQDGYFDPLRPDPDCPDCHGTGFVTRSTGAFSWQQPCLCNPEHGSHHSAAFQDFVAALGSLANEVEIVHQRAAVVVKYRGHSIPIGKPGGRLPDNLFDLVLDWKSSIDTQYGGKE